MADTIKIPVEILPTRFEEIKQKLRSIIDPKTLSADAQILFQGVLGSFNLAQAEMESQMAENKFNMPKLNLKNVDKQLFGLIKKVQEDLGQALPESFVQAQKELDKINNELDRNARMQKQLITEIQAMPTIAEEAKSVAPQGFKKFGVAGDEAATAKRILELEKQISETKDKRKLGPLQKELEYQKKVLEVTERHNKALKDKEGRLNQLQSAEASYQAMADVQRDKQAEAMAGQQGTVDPAVAGLMSARDDIIKQQAVATKFQADYNQAKKESAKTEKAEAAAAGAAGDSIANKATKVLALNLIYQQLRRILMQSIRTIRDLDKALTDAAVVTSMTRKQAWELVGAYRELAKTTGLATTEIAGIVTQFLRQGRSLADALKLAEVAAKSAKVAGISAKEAVDFLTSAVNGFGLSADQAEDIADKFASIAARSATSFEELAKAMSKVSPTAKSAGVSVDFMMGVIAKGIETTREAPENIGTAFKTIFARMREVTDLGKSMEDGMNLNRVEKALLSVNVPLRDVSGQFRNLEEVLIDVGDKWTTLTSVEQAYLATALAGSRQQPRLLAIFNDFARTKELIQISSEATGGLALQHMEYMTGMEAALTRMRTAWEGFVTAIVDADIVVAFFAILQNAIEGVTSVVEAIGPSATIMIGLITGIGAAYLLTAHKVQAYITSLKQSAVWTGILNGVQKAANALVLVSNLNQMRAIILLTRSNADAKKEIGLMLQRKGLKISEATLDQLLVAVRKKDIKERNKQIALLVKKTIAEVFGIKVTAASTIAQAANTKATALASAGNIVFGKSLIFATMGLILIIPLILGIVAGMISFAKSITDSSKKSSEFGKTMKPIADIIKAVVSIFKDLFKIVFDLGKFIALFTMSIAALGVKLLMLNPNVQMLFLAIKAVSVVLKAVSTLIRLLGNLVQNLVQGFLDMIESIEDIPLLGDIIRAITGLFNALGTALDNASEYLDNINTELEIFGQRANESTVKLNEFTKNVDKIDRLQEEFKKLNSQANKTPADLQRIDDILQELANVEIDGKTFDFTTEINGVVTLNDDMLQKTLGELRDQETQMVKDLNEIIDDAVQAYGTAGNAVTNDFRGAFEEEGVIDAARYLGQRFVKTYVDQIREGGEISSEITNSVQSGLNSALAGADEEFFNMFIRSGQFSEGLMRGYIQSLVSSSAQQLDSLSDSLATINDKEIAANKKVEESVIAKANAYEQAVKEINNRFKGNQEKIDFALNFITKSMEEESILYKLLNESKFKVDAIVNMQMAGVSIANIQEFLTEEFANIMGNIGRASGGRGITTEYTTQLRNEFSNATASAFSGSASGIESGLKEFARLLNIAEIPLEDFEEAFIRISNSITTLSAQATADLLENQRKSNEKLFSLPEQIKKGDFKNYIDAVGDFGLDVVKGLMTGSSDDAADFLAAQTEKTLMGIEASIQKIITTADILGKDLTDIEKQEIAMLESMYSYYQDIVAVEQLRTYQLKEANDLMKEANDLVKLQEGLMKFGMEGDSPILQTLKNLVAETEALGQSKAVETLQGDLERLQQYGSFEDGVFAFFNPDEVEYDIIAAKIALENYTDSLSNLVEIQNQSYERQKKVIEERYKEEINAIKTSNDEKWKAIDYSDKLIDAEERIAASRRALMGLALSGASSGMVDQAQKDLEKMQKERQKMIEQQMVEQAQKQLEAERDLAMQELGQQQITAMGNLTQALVDLTDTIEETPTVTGTTTGGTTTQIVTNRVDFANADSFSLG